MVSLKIWTMTDQLQLWPLPLFDAVPTYRVWGTNHLHEPSLALGKLEGREAGACRDGGSFNFFLSIILIYTCIYLVGTEIWKHLIPTKTRASTLASGQPMVVGGSAQIVADACYSSIPYWNGRRT